MVSIGLDCQNIINGYKWGLEHYDKFKECLNIFDNIFGKDDGYVPKYIFKWDNYSSCVIICEECGNFYQYKSTYERKKSKIRIYCYCD